MGKWLLKIEGKEEDDYLTMFFSCRISRAVIIKTVVGVSGVGSVIAVIQHYIH
jgi:hypothetical protein